LYKIIYFFIDFLFLIVPLLLCVAVISLAERKVMGSIQRRRGPNVLGFFGILQPFADGVKLFLKEFTVPSNVDKFLFFFSPVLCFSTSLMLWCILPLPGQTGIVYDIELGVLYVLGVGSLNVYGVILAGWASNSKYAFLGGLRAASQMISYEVSLGLCILPVVLLAGSFNFFYIVFVQQTIFNVFFIFPAALLFLVSLFAETNRTPFDLPEAEGELVAGFNVEYSSMFFAFFFLAEYANILFMSFIFVVLFLGGWYIFNSFSLIGYYLKICAVIFFFIWVRAALPRYRFDQLIQLGWKVFLPFTMGYFLFVAGTVFCVGQLVEFS
jgi:NADH-quinone oxidoreductase subunit H